MKILLLADTTHPTAAVSDHISAITQHSKHEWYTENPLMCRVLHKLDFSTFDAIGFHYSIRPHHAYYVPRPLYKKIAQFKGLKFQFLQDEYSQVQIAMNAMAELDISMLFTLVRPDLVKQAYPDPRLSNMTFVTVLTGYIPENLLAVDVPPISDRKLDVFYRSRECSYWLGCLAQDKVRIANTFREKAKQTDLTVDISVQEEDRVYGEEWINRLSNARAVLGTESGASIWDFTGQVEIKTRKYLCKHPYATFEQVSEKILSAYEGNVLYSAVSPRVFEAASLKTPMVMFPGWYSDVCVPGKHYIQLEKDFSNFDEVVEKLKDTQYLQKMADQTYTDLVQSGKYHQRMLAKLVDESLSGQDVAGHQSSGVHVHHHIEMLAAKHKFAHFSHWIWIELTFARHNFFRILFDRSTPLSEKLGKLYNGGKRYALYLKPRLERLFGAVAE